MTEDVTVLFCPTVPHTGTTFLLEFLKDDPAIKDYVTLQWLIRWHGERTPGLNLIHTHFKKNLHAHIATYASRWPTIVPLRDPLLAVLTSYHRNKEGNYVYQVDQFINLVKIIDQGPTAYTPIYVPFDLMDNLPDGARIHLFLASLSPLKFLSQEHCITWATRWPRIESWGDYPYKSLYYQGRVEEIKPLIPNEWDALINARPILKPFLEARGYKDLLWWL